MSIKNIKMSNDYSRLPVGHGKVFSKSIFGDLKAAKIKLIFLKSHENTIDMQIKRNNTFCVDITLVRRCR